jgi:hypothetical protein
MSMEDRPLATTSYRASDVSFGREFRRIGRSTTAGTVLSKELRKVRREQQDERTGQPSYGLILDQHAPWISNPDRSRGCWRHC